MSRRLKARPLVPAVGIGLGVVTLLLSADPTLAQCAMCGQAAAASSVETREALNYAIIGMAMAPYAVAALAAWVASPALREHVRLRLRLRIHQGEGPDQP